MRSNQIPYEKIAGKTIAGILNPFEDLLIAFSDGTFCIVSAVESFALDSYMLEDGTLVLHDWAAYLDELHRLNIINSVDVDIVRESIEKMRVGELEARRAQYERLKAEFEKESV